MDGFGEGLKFMVLGVRLFQQVNSCCLRKRAEPSEGQLCANYDRGFDYVDARRHHIGDQQIRLEALRLVKHLVAAIDGTRLKTRSVQNDRKCVGYHSFVIGNEHFSSCAPWHILFEFLIPFAASQLIPTLVWCATDNYRDVRVSRSN